MGVSLSQPWSSRRRCFRQYERLQCWHSTPMTRGVFINVLHAGSEHCCSWVKRFGLVEGVEVFEAGESARALSALARAHAPALVHECAVSERWSRQNLLLKRLAYLSWAVGTRYTHPLQLSHLNGRRSSCLQNGIWHWAPIASTSPTDMAV